MITECPECCKTRYQTPEPLQVTQLPELPWQQVASDLFEFRGSSYLLVVDYFSRYIEIVKLRATTSDEVIQQLKEIFSRHGIPQVLRTDNRPQYSSYLFQEFSRTYNFEHVSSSPRYPQSNGEAERAVKTIKSFLKKAKDPYLALLLYRSTPLQNGYSPAELLMNRKLRTTIPMS